MDTRLSLILILHSLHRDRRIPRVEVYPHPLSTTVIYSLGGCKSLMRMEDEVKPHHYTGFHMAIALEGEDNPHLYTGSIKPIYSGFCKSIYTRFRIEISKRRENLLSASEAVRYPFSAWCMTRIFYLAFGV